MNPQPLCKTTRDSPSFRWVCIRPEHGGDHPVQDAYRRRRGITPNADKHVMVRADRA